MIGANRNSFIITKASVPGPLYFKAAGRLNILLLKIFAFYEVVLDTFYSAGPNVLKLTHFRNKAI